MRTREFITVSKEYRGTKGVAVLALSNNVKQYNRNFSVTDSATHRQINTFLYGTSLTPVTGASCYLKDSTEGHDSIQRLTKDSPVMCVGLPC